MQLYRERGGSYLGAWSKGLWKTKRVDVVDFPLWRFKMTSQEALTYSNCAWISASPILNPKFCSHLNFFSINSLQNQSNSLFRSWGVKETERNQCFVGMERREMRENEGLWFCDVTMMKKAMLNYFRDVEGRWERGTEKVTVFWLKKNPIFTLFPLIYVVRYVYIWWM